MTVSTEEETIGQGSIDASELRSLEKKEKTIDDVNIPLHTSSEPMQKTRGLRRIPTYSSSLSEDLSFLREVVSNMGESGMEKLVAHRGFHDSTDKTPKSRMRPIENTLQAYTLSWASGVKHAEVDILALKDGHLVLNHDDDLNRFAMGEIGHTTTKLTELTYPEVLCTPLVNGLTVPLLTDVLRHAVALEGKVVAELKFDPANMHTTKLVELMVAEPTFINALSVVMSFELEAVQKFSWAYEQAGLPLEERPKVMWLTISNEEEKGDLFGWGPEAKPYAFYKPPEFGSIKQEVETSSIDGVYIEWEPDLLGRYREEFEKLCSEVTVGVWMHGCDPNDRAHIASDLMGCGASFVNTDFPRKYLRANSTPKVANAM